MGNPGDGGLGYASPPRILQIRIPLDPLQLLRLESWLNNSFAALSSLTTVSILGFLLMIGGNGLVRTQRPVKQLTQFYHQQIAKYGNWGATKLGGH